MTMIENRKKIAILTLLIMIINIFMPIIVNAEETASISLNIEGDQKDYYDVGEEFTVSVNFANPQSGAKALTGLINFDESKLEITNCVLSDTVIDQETGKQVNLYELDIDTNIGQQVSMVTYQEDKGITFAFQRTLGLRAGSFDINFRVKENASGPVDISLSNILYSNAEENETDYTINKGEDVTVNIPVPLTSIEITPSGETTLGVGESKIFNVIYNPEDTTDDKTVEWSSDNTRVATVEQSGKVTAVEPGTATIKAKVGTKESTVTVRVTSHLTKIELDPSIVNLETNTENNKKTLSVIYTPNNTTDSKTVTWTSSNEDVVTVTPSADSQTAEITAVGNGTANITVHSNLEGVADSITRVNVITAVESISLNKQQSILNKGNEEQLDLTIEPENASIKSIVWTSTDDSVATVDQNGKVTALKAGSTTITVRVTDNNDNVKSATCNIEVKVPLNSISLCNNFELLPKQSKQLEVTYNPEDTTDNRTVTWTTTDTAIATVDQNGKVTAVKPGTATIKATVGDHEATVIVTVPEVHIDTVYINKTETSIEKGNSETLNVIINPEDTTDDKTVTWSSTDTTIATVDQNGKVTAVAPGTATIKATVAGKTAECIVTVTSTLTDITLSTTNVTFEKGHTVTITVTYNPEDTTDDKTVTWSSDNENVATVDENGVITGKTAGSAIIKAKVGNITKTVKVKVIVPLIGISLKSKTTILKGGSETLVVTYNPEDTTSDKTVTWTSSDTTVATVDQNGKVTALKEGTANITATVGSLTATTEVTVKEIKMTGINITNRKDKLYKNEVLNLSIIFTPEDTTDNKTVIWSSSDEDVAIVDQNGKVIALKEGNVTITAKVRKENSTRADEYFEDSVEIEVAEIHTESITLSTDVTNDVIYVGDQFNISASFYPLETTDSKILTFVSSDESIATVDENGKVTAIAPGEVTITAIDENGIKSQITVKITEADVEEENKKVDSPKTGDINIALYVSLMIISLLGIIVEIKRK